MIIVRIIGGLGNQMFQYAAGRQLAALNNTDLKLDISDFRKYNLRDYGLSAFNIKELFATPEEIQVYKEPEAGRLMKKIKNLLGRPSKLGMTHIREKQFNFSPEILALPDSLYLDGYWQSEKYFLGIADIIRKEFTVKFPQTGKDLELAQQITSCESVSLHVRRGDYVTDEKTRVVHGTCDLAYYERCIERLAQQIHSPHFFIFSDDPEWTGKNLKMAHPATFVSHNGCEKNYEDLRLMSQCRHHIVANSSFSWWGAWLNSNSNKITYAPKQWFRDPNFNTMDLLPATWQKL